MSAMTGTVLLWRWVQFELCVAALRKRFNNVESWGINVRGFVDSRRRSGRTAPARPLRNDLRPHTMPRFLRA
eukprot:1035720-Rhodomonas_salina.5